MQHIKASIHLQTLNRKPKNSQIPINFNKICTPKNIESPKKKTHRQAELMSEREQHWEFTLWSDSEAKASRAKRETRRRRKADRKVENMAAGGQRWADLQRIRTQIESFCSKEKLKPRIWAFPTSHAWERFDLLYFIFIFYIFYFLFLFNLIVDFLFFFCLKFKLCQHEWRNQTYHYCA